MRSDKQNQTSRKNGSKSQGPVTPEGKANSAKNATTHNLSGAHFVLLTNENPEEFAVHRREYLMRFQPVDGVEYDLVQQMIVASWRQRRIGAMESALFEIEMARQEAGVRLEFLQIDPPGRQVLALFGTTEAAAASSLLLRYAASARRDYTTALRTLRDLQGDRFNRNSRSAVQSASPNRSVPTPPPNDPSPESAPWSAPWSANDTAAVNSASPIPAIESSVRPGVTVLRRPILSTPQNGEIQDEPKAAVAGCGFPDFALNPPYFDAA